MAWPPTTHGDVKDEIDKLRATPSATTVGIFYVDPTNGNDANDGRTWQTAVATIAQALTLCANQSQVGEIRLSRGVHNVSSTLVIPQAVKLRGFGTLNLQETEVVWTGANDGSYVIRTSGDTSVNDFTRGELSGFLVRGSATGNAGGAYTNLNGIYARNLQNGAYLSNLKVQNMPGIGIMADWANAAVPTGAFPGWSTFDRVWSTGCNVNWHIKGGFTSVLYHMCAADVSTNTTDVFILDPPTGGSIAGRHGNHVFIGFKTEDNGGGNVSARYFTINSDAGLSFIGCSAKRGTDSGTNPWIDYTFTPVSFHAEPGEVPVTLINCQTSNINVALRGPGSVELLKPVSATAGQVFHIASWSSKDRPRFPKVADSFNRIDSASTLGNVERGGVAWTAGTGVWGISANQAYLTASIANAVAYVETGLSDCRIRATFSAINANAQWLVFRLTDASNFYYMNPGGSVFRVVAGTGTNIGSTSGISFAAGDVAEVIVQGTTVYMYKNGQRIRVPLDIGSTGQTATKHGIGQNSNVQGRFDDFSVTPI